MKSKLEKGRDVLDEAISRLQDIKENSDSTWERRELDDLIDGVRDLQWEIDRVLEP